MAVDWMMRTYAPTWLAAADLPAATKRLVQLREVGDSVTLRPAVEVLREARRDTRAACGLRDRSRGRRGQRGVRPPAKPHGARAAPPPGPPLAWLLETWLETALARSRGTSPVTARPRSPERLERPLAAQPPVKRRAWLWPPR